MSGTKASTALQVAHGAHALIALNAQGAAEPWIMLLPIDKAGMVTTIDGRGPYRVPDPAALARASLNAAGGVPLPIDENHATDLAAPRGEPAPARGWVTELQARDGGIFGKVDWTEAGRALVSDKAYRSISPALSVNADKTVGGILRASLVNTPNLRGMAALHQEIDMNELLAKLRKMLGLADDADADAICNKVQNLATSTSMNSIAVAAGLDQASSAEKVLATVKALKERPSLQAELAPIAKAAGLKEDAKAADIVAAVTTLGDGGAAAIVELQAELKELGAKFITLQTSGAKEKAVAFVDGAIKEGRVGIKPLRDKYITMHAANPAETEALINAMPKIKAGSVIPDQPELKDGKVELNSEQSKVAKLLGIKTEDMAKTVAAEAATEE